VSRIGEIEHTPERSIWVRLGDLEQRKIWGIRRGEGELVNGRKDTGIGDGPFEVSGRFTANDSYTTSRMTRIRSRGLVGAGAAGREELGDTEIALWRGREQVILRVLFGSGQLDRASCFGNGYAQSSCEDTSREYLWVGLRIQERVRVHCVVTKVELRHTVGGHYQGWQVIRD